MKAVSIDERLELFVDHQLVDQLDGLALHLHEPRPMPLATRPLHCFYTTVIKDGDLYRAYYRDYHLGYEGDRYDGNPAEVTCYAESRDGHEWIYPTLNISDVKTEGRARMNSTGEEGFNVILADAAPFSHNFSPFLDGRAEIPQGERFKALAGVHGGAEPLANGVQNGLHYFASGDGIHWKMISDKPVIATESFGFDSQNVAFWSEAENCYVCYFRTFQSPYGELRSIARTTSEDFLHWTEPVPTNPNLPGEHLYTSNTHPYFRAPHIYIALPTRYVPDRGSSTDILFMATRAGATTYTRLFKQAFIRPGLDPVRWGNRSNYVALNVVPTSEEEMSIYHKSGHRYTLRTDGFVSVRAGAVKGELLTKPLTFKGSHLVLNYSTSAAGSLQVEMQDHDGNPIPGLRLDDCPPIVGDKIEHCVQWKESPDLAALIGKPVRLRFAMAECDLYSFRFRSQ